VPLRPSPVCTLSYFPPLAPCTRRSFCLHAAPRFGRDLFYISPAWPLPLTWGCASPVPRHPHRPLLVDALAESRGTVPPRLIRPRTNRCRPALARGGTVTPGQRRASSAARLRFDEISSPAIRRGLSSGVSSNLPVRPRTRPPSR